MLEVMSIEFIAKHIPTASIGAGRHRLELIDFFLHRATYVGQFGLRLGDPVPTPVMSKTLGESRTGGTRRVRYFFLRGALASTPQTCFKLFRSRISLASLKGRYSFCSSIL